jgi:hypothetical protein
MKIVLVVDEMQPRVCVRNGKRMSTIMICDEGVWKIYCEEWKVEGDEGIIEIGDYGDTFEVDELIGQMDVLIERYRGGEDMYRKIKEIY